MVKALYLFCPSEFLALLLKIYALIICISFMCMVISVFPSFATLSAMYISLSLKYEWALLGLSEQDNSHFLLE